MASALDKSHECRDKWGDPHVPTDLVKLTLDHIKVNGVRYDDALHCVAMCSKGNVTDRWSSAWENNHLANVYLLGIRVGMGLRVA